MPFSSHFIAMTPPPEASKSGPYEALLHSVTSQPLLLFKLASQLVRFAPLSAFLRVSGYIKWLQPNSTHINSSRKGYVRIYHASWYPMKNGTEEQQWHQLTRSCVPCNLVMFIIMNTFQNIDFSVLRMRLSKERRFEGSYSYPRPVGSYGPKGRPDSFNSGTIRCVL